MISAKQKGDALLADIKKALNEPDMLHVWWLGQSGYLVQWQGKHLLLDPYLSDSLTKKYAETDKPHVRMSELVIVPDKLDFIDLVTSSHNHTDHLDGETLIPLFQVNPEATFVIPEANRAFVVNRIGSDESFPIGMEVGKSIEVAGFTLIAVPAAHEELDTDEKGRNKYLGYIIKCGPWTLYHSGDTLWYAGMENILKQFGIDLAFLPINGRDTRRRVAGNLNAYEAVHLAQVTGIKHIIPCHYDMFTFNTANPKEFAQIADGEGQAYSILAGGERWQGKTKNG